MAWQPGDPIPWTKSIAQVEGFMKGAVRAGLSANISLEILKSQGHGVRRSDYLQVYKAISYAYEDSAIYLPGDLSGQIDTRFVPLAPYSQRRTYSVTTYIDAKMPYQTEITRNRLTLHYDELPSYAEIMDDLILDTIPTSLKGVIVEDLGIEVINYSDNPIFGAYR